MLPARISVSVFHALEKVVSIEDRNLMNQVYRLDENYFNPLYLLQPIDSNASRDCQETSARLARILREAANRCYAQEKTITEHDRNEFLISGRMKVFRMRLAAGVIF